MQGRICFCVFEKGSFYSFQTSLNYDTIFSQSIEKGAERVIKTVKFLFVSNALVFLALLFLPIFLVTDRIDVFNSAIAYLWKET